MKHFYQNIQGWFTYPSLYSKVVSNAPDKAHFVEVGVWKGTSAAYMAVEIINSGKNIKFDCIDTWNGSSEHLDINSSVYEPGMVEDKDFLYNTFIEGMKPVEGHYTAYRTTSIEASKQYEDNSLDFVFIDAAHDYDSVKADIEAWIGKVKEGGILAGHDYGWYPGVNKAVDEVLGRENISQQEGCWYLPIKFRV